MSLNIKKLSLHLSIGLANDNKRRFKSFFVYHKKPILFGISLGRLKTEKAIRRYKHKSPINKVIFNIKNNTK